jgi:hypothetical protein
VSTQEWNCIQGECVTKFRYIMCGQTHVRRNMHGKGLIISARDEHDDHACYGMIVSMHDVHDERA